MVTLKNVEISCHFRNQHNGPEHCYPTWTTLYTATYLYDNIFHKKKNSKERYWMQLPCHHTNTKKNALKYEFGF